jgi:2-amino-4-hydroxy-6-hydroxymethyldihydropteridine diphosphokinase
MSNIAGRMTAPEGGIRVALGLGSNLGDRRANLERALALLSRTVLDEARASTFVSSDPQDCPPETPAFLNAVVIGVCHCSPRRLLRACQDIEERLGRPRDHAYRSNRPIDIDILLYGNRQVDRANLKIPHPRLHERAFVLEPLAELAPDWSIPGCGQCVAGALAALHQKKRGAHPG